MKIKPRLGWIAFWGYDLFPYLLCGTIDAISVGRVQTKEYGKGYYFTPKFVLPSEEGKELKEKLDLLKQERDETLGATKANYENRLKQLLDS